MFRGISRLRGEGLVAVVGMGVDVAALRHCQFRQGCFGHGGFGAWIADGDEWMSDACAPGKRRDGGMEVNAHAPVQRHAVWSVPVWRAGGRARTQDQDARAGAGRVSSPALGLASRKKRKTKLGAATTLGRGECWPTPCLLARPFFPV